LELGSEPSAEVGGLHWLWVMIEWSDACFVFFFLPYPMPMITLIGWECRLSATGALLSLLMGDGSPGS